MKTLLEWFKLVISILGGGWAVWVGIIERKVWVSFFGALILLPGVTVWIGIYTGMNTPTIVDLCFTLLPLAAALAMVLLTDELCRSTKLYANTAEKAAINEVKPIIHLTHNGARGEESDPKGGSSSGRVTTPIYVYNVGKGAALDVAVEDWADNSVDAKCAWACWEHDPGWAVRANPSATSLRRVIMQGAFETLNLTIDQDKRPGPPRDPHRDSPITIKISWTDVDKSPSSGEWKVDLDTKGGFVTAIRRSR